MSDGSSLQQQERLCDRQDLIEITDVACTRRNATQYGWTWRITMREIPRRGRRQPEQSIVDTVYAPSRMTPMDVRYVRNGQR